MATSLHAALDDRHANPVNDKSITAYDDEVANGVQAGVLRETQPSAQEPRIRVPNQIHRTQDNGEEESSDDEPLSYIHKKRKRGNEENETSDEEPLFHAQKRRR